MQRHEEAAEIRERLVQAHSDSMTFRSDLSWSLNNIARELVTPSRRDFRDPDRAVELARRAVQLAPDEGNHYNTLGATLYEAGHIDEAIEALTRALELGHQFDAACNGFYLAMSHWKRAERNVARDWFDRAATHFDEHAPWHRELAAIRAEAASLLEIDDPDPTSRGQEQP